MKFEFNDEQRKRLTDYCREKPEIVGVYVHGSQVKGNAAPDSDTDVAVVVDKPYDFDRKIKEIGKIEDVLDVSEPDIKFVTVNFSSPVFMFAVIKYGVCVYSKTETDKLQFESLVMRKYYDSQHRLKIYGDYLKKSILSYAN